MQHQYLSKQYKLFSKSSIREIFTKKDEHNEYVEIDYKFTKYRTITPYLLLLYIVLFI